MSEIANPLVPMAKFREELGKPCRQTIYNMVKRGQLPALVKLNGKNHLPGKELSAIKSALIAGKSDDEIRALVVKLEADRVKVAA